MRNDNKKQTGFIIVLIMIAGFAGYAGVNFRKAGRSAPEKMVRDEKTVIDVDQTKMLTMVDALRLIGNIEAFETVTVFSKVPGKIITRIYYEKGEFVKKGALVAELEDESIRAKIEEAVAASASEQAGLKQAEANLDVLKKDRDRLYNLYKEKAVARQKLDHIEAQFKASQEGVELARARIKRADAVKKQLAILYQEHKIFSPINGVVYERYVDPGALSAPAVPILQIAHEEKVKIIFSVPEKEFTLIKKGMEADIVVDAYPDQNIKGTVTIISPSMDAVTRTGSVEVHIKNKNKMLRPGMFAKIRLFLRTKNVIAVSRDALVRMPGTGSYYVFVVENDRAVQKNIKIGSSQNGYMEVVSGLKSGETVVIRGQNRLKDDMPVVRRTGNRSGMKKEAV